jgi:hypothetical protein
MHFCAAVVTSAERRDGPSVLVSVREKTNVCSLLVDKREGKSLFRKPRRTIYGSMILKRMTGCELNLFCSG